MNRNLLLFVFSIFLLSPAFGQTFDIKPTSAAAAKANIKANGIVNDLAQYPITSVFISCTSPADATNKFDVFQDAVNLGTFTGSEKDKEFRVKAPITDLRNVPILIKKTGTTIVVAKCTFKQKPLFDIGVGNTAPALTFDKDYIADQSAINVPIGTIWVGCPAQANVQATYKLTVVKDGKTVDCGTFVADGARHQQGAAPAIEDLGNLPMTLTDQADNTDIITFTIKTATKQDIVGKPKGPGVPLGPVIDEIKKKFPVLAATVFGLQVPGGNRNTSYTGTKYVHIFLDQFGNNIFSTMPAGISNRQYVVHIFYQEDENDPNSTDYSINQTSGEFQDALVFNNAGQLSTIELRAGKDNVVPTMRWVHKEFLLSTSTTDIQFDVVRTDLKAQDNKSSSFENQTLKTYTIKMSKVYHGSFDVGLINSTLENPDFELVTSPANSAEKVAKKNGGSNRGVVTAMATFYTSPIILLESLFGNKKIPNYMLSGRNFLEDHKIYERIYPAVGMGFTDKTLENLFFGFDWEFARGGSIFLGWHYGKVNVFNAPTAFKFEKTAITDDQFNLYKNTAWKTNFAIGLNLDIMIIRNLFRPATEAPAAGGN